MKGLFAWIGFPCKEIEYDRDGRYAGETKWNYWRLWNFALEGITSFSVVPLKIASYMGFLAALVAFARGAYFVAKTLIYGDPVPGFPTLVVVVLFLGGLQLMALGIIGEYLARMFIEVKQRPLYLVQRRSRPRGRSRPTPRIPQPPRRRRMRPSRPRDHGLRADGRASAAGSRWSSWSSSACGWRRCGAYPLMDSTESRYAEIARKMLETGDWVMPQFDYGVPFWGKPPLSTWLSAAAMAAFGSQRVRGPTAVVAAADRLRRARPLARRAARRPRPGAVDARAVRGHRPRVRRRRRGDDRSRARARNHAVDGGVLGRGEWRRAGASRRGRPVLSSGSSIGLLAKGPVAAVLTFVPVGAWTLWTRRWRAVWRALPWLAGAGATAIAGRPLVLGGRARLAGISRLLPGRRALEALCRTRLERRSLRRRARPAARHDLALLDRGGAAVVAVGARLARARGVRAPRRPAPARRRPLARLSRAVDRDPDAVLHRVRKRAADLRAARSARVRAAAGRALAARHGRLAHAAARGPAHDRRRARDAGGDRRGDRHATPPLRIRPVAPGAGGNLRHAPRQPRRAAHLCRAATGVRRVLRARQDDQGSGPRGASRRISTMRFPILWCSGRRISTRSPPRPAHDLRRWASSATTGCSGRFRADVRCRERALRIDQVPSVSLRRQRLPRRRPPARATIPTAGPGGCGNAMLRRRAEEEPASAAPAAPRCAPRSAGASRTAPSRRPCR